ncbi:nicotinate-nucleotide adenylyltransferase [Candidatus Aerophobetes bacterium]|nr:nicotinate-nucleotide adenylyltransferase [Candidatus Aerophobetes bacterium]
MSKEILKLGIMGGTFNPIHQGHLVTAEVVRDEFKLDKVIFIPSGKPPHKDNNEIVSSDHRWMMTVLATISNKYFSVSSIEVKKKGESYTRDTILELKKIYGEASDCYFITGADVIAEISTWHKVKDLPKLTKFIAVSRPGYKLDINKIDSRFRKCTYLIEVPALAISSTEIRKRVKGRQSIKYLLPEAVESYIYKNSLYL